jgi:hypothetical protein
VPTSRIDLRQTAVFFERRLALSFAETGHGSAQSGHNALLPKYNHSIEERRRHRLAHDRHAGGIDKQAGFDAACFRNRAGRMIASVVVPLAKRFKRIREFRE